MDITDFLSPADALVELRAPDKTRLLQELSGRAASTLGLDAERISADLLKREELGSTGMGNGVAIPHARFAELAMNAGTYAGLGWQVVAVIAQSSTAVRRYVEDKGLPFNILIDSSRDVAKAYGVWQRIGIDAWNIARPSLFLIEPGGRIRYSFVASRQDEFPGHDEILKEIGAGS